MSSLELGMRPARRLPFHLTACNGCLNARVHPAAVGGEVGIAVRGHEEQATGLSPVDPIFQLPRLACEPAEVIDHDGVEESHLVVLHHAEIGRVLLRLVTYRAGLIDVSLDNLHTQNAANFS